MNTLTTSCRFLLAVLLAAGLFASASFAQTASPSPATATAAAPAGMPSEAEMMKMMTELAKLNENHKLLGQLAGNWNYTIKMWMDPNPNAKPMESKGTATRKSVMDGRYYTVDVTGKMMMPDAEGKMKEMDFKGMSIEAYDNVKKKFVSTWADNMATGIMISEGTYDPTNKTFTYTSDCEMMPGMPIHVREVIKVVDADHHTFEWYDNSRGTEAKTMEIAYARAK
jgi:hypothetical protein